MNPELINSHHLNTAHQFLQYLNTGNYNKLFVIGKKMGLCLSMSGTIIPFYSEFFHQFFVLKRDSIHRPIKPYSTELEALTL